MKKSGNTQWFPVIIIGLGAVLILGSILWLFNATQASLALSENTESPVSSPRIPYPNIQRISLGDAKAAFDLKQAIFLDVRGDPYYSQGHIPGALSISTAELESRLGELDKNAWIITYCT